MTASTAEKKFNIVVATTIILEILQINSSLVTLEILQKIVV
jgi:hypothetical protein